MRTLSVLVCRFFTIIWFFIEFCVIKIVEFKNGITHKQNCLERSMNYTYKILTNKSYNSSIHSNIIKVNKAKHECCHVTHV